MDKEQAQFILRSFRPDGADAADPDFAAALQLAATDRQLGEWWVEERSFDSKLAEAIASSPVPPDLRDEILASLTATRGDLPQVEGSFDAAMVGAMASIQPPHTLRPEAIAAMERSAHIRNRARISRLAIPFAAAAGIALAFFLTRSDEVRSPATASMAEAAPATPQPVPVEIVEAGFLRTFTTPFFTLDQPRTEDLGMPVEHLTERKLPCPSLLPPGLQGLKNVGCRELVIDGKRGSLVCFDETGNGTVHLVIFRREDVCGKLPCQKSPNFAQHGSFAIARWSDDRHVFMLMGTTEISRLASLF